MNNKVKKTLLIVAVVCLSLFLLFSFIAALATITTGKSLALFFTCFSVIFLLLIVNCVKSIKNNPIKNKKIMLIFYASLMVVAFACIPFFPETQTHEAINEKSAIKSSDSDKEKTVDILENISEKTIEMKQENDTEISHSNDDDSNVKIETSAFGDEVKPSNIYEIREELKNKYFVTEPAPFVLGDATGKWRISKISSGYPTYEYAVKYAKAYMNNGDVYYIVNFQLKTTSMLHLLNGILEVKTTEYVKKEEHDAKKIGNGMLYTDQFFKLESGEELKTSGNSTADKIADATTVTQQEQKTSAPTEKKTSATIGQKNALKSAKQYLSVMGFSKSGLVKQLEFDGYSTEDATYAAENCNADWNKQAAKSAKNYIDTMPFSKSGLIQQLEFDGYSASEAEYGAKAVGY